MGIHYFFPACLITKLLMIRNIKLKFYSLKKTHLPTKFLNVLCQQKHNGEGLQGLHWPCFEPQHVHQSNCAPPRPSLGEPNSDWTTSSACSRIRPLVTIPKLKL